MHIDADVIRESAREAARRGRGLPSYVKALPARLRDEYISIFNRESECANVLMRRAA